MYKWDLKIINLLQSNIKELVQRFKLFTFLVNRQYLKMRKKLIGNMRIYSNPLTSQNTSHYQG